MSACTCLPVCLPLWVDGLLMLGWSLRLAGCLQYILQYPLLGIMNEYNFRSPSRTPNHQKAKHPSHSPNPISPTLPIS